MIAFSSSPRAYKQAGLGIFLAQLCVYAMSLPPLRYGLWVRIESIMLGVFLLSALGGAWLAAGLWKKWLMPSRPASALWWCLIAWAGWNLVATAMAPMPWVSWFGHPEQGEGAAWHIASFLSLLLAYTLWQEPSYRRHIVVVAAFNIVILIALHLANRDALDGLWLPGLWMNYLTYMYGWLWMVLLSGEKAPRLRIFVWFMALGAFLLLVADNVTSAVLLSYAMLVTGVVLWAAEKGLPYFTRVTKTWRVLASVACLLPLLWLPASFYAERMFSDMDSSIAERASMIEAGLTSLADHPARLIAGHGWGGFSDDLFGYAFTSGLHRYAHGALAPNSINLTDDMFHSHCQPLEALLSLGLPGMLLWLALPLIVIWTIPALLFWRIVPMLVALTAMSYLWFLLPQVMAYQALALAVLCSVCRRDKTSAVLAATWPAIIAAIFALLMLWSGWQQHRAMRYGETLAYAVMENAYDQYDPSWITGDIARGGHRLRYITIHAALAYARGDPAKATANDRGWMARLLHAADVMAYSPRVGVRAASTELWLQDALMTQLASPVYDALRREAMLFAPATVAQMAVRVPRREDMAAVYLQWLEKDTKDDLARRVDVLSRLLAVSSDHRSALWLLGKTFSQTEGYEQIGRSMMRRAVGLGVDKIYPVSDEEVAALKNK